jgi:hypothetical protein
MCAQVDLDVVGKRFKEEGRPPNFHEFWSGGVHCIKDHDITNIIGAHYISNTSQLLRIKLMLYKY